MERFPVLNSRDYSDEYLSGVESLDSATNSPSPANARGMERHFSRKVYTYDSLGRSSFSYNFPKNNLRGRSSRSVPGTPVSDLVDKERHRALSTDRETMEKYKRAPGSGTKVKLFQDPKDKAKYADLPPQGGLKDSSDLYWGPPSPLEKEISPRASRGRQKQTFDSSQFYFSHDQITKRPIIKEQVKAPKEKPLDNVKKALNFSEIEGDSKLEESFLPMEKESLKIQEQEQMLNRKSLSSDQSGFVSQSDMTSGYASAETRDSVGTADMSRLSIVPSHEGSYLTDSIVHQAVQNLQPREVMGEINTSGRSVRDIDSVEIQLVSGHDEMEVISDTEEDFELQVVETSVDESQNLSIGVLEESDEDDNENSPPKMATVKKAPVKLPKEENGEEGVDEKETEEAEKSHIDIPAYQQLLKQQKEHWHQLQMQLEAQQQHQLQQQLEQQKLQEDRMEQLKHEMHLQQDKIKQQQEELEKSKLEQQEVDAKRIEEKQRLQAEREREKQEFEDYQKQLQIRQAEELHQEMQNQLELEERQRKEIQEQQRKEIMRLQDLAKQQELERDNERLKEEEERRSIYEQQKQLEKHIAEIQELEQHSFSKSGNAELLKQPEINEHQTKKQEFHEKNVAPAKPARAHRRGPTSTPKIRSLHEQRGGKAGKVGGQSATTSDASTHGNDETSPGFGQTLDISSISSLHTSSPTSARNRQHSGVSSMSIQSMEQVRGHLHSMLQMSGLALPNKSLYDQTVDDVQLLLDEDKDKDQTFNSNTSFPQTGAGNMSELPQIESLINFGSGILHSARQQPGTVNPAGSALIAENTMLKEMMEKEKFKKKHLEKEIGELQTKMLDLQQQLAVAVSTDRKKDTMIEQLDKALAKVVEGWKTKEEEKMVQISKIQGENDEMKATQARQQQMLVRFEQELSDTVEQLRKAQERAEQAETDSKQQAHEQEIERTETTKLLEQDRERLTVVTVERDQLALDKEKLQSQLLDATHILDSERETWEEKEQEYLQKIEEITDNHLAGVEQEKQRSEKQSQMLNDTREVLSATQTELQDLHMHLENANREKESLRVEMGLLEARLESSKRKLEAELRATYERQLTERVEEAHQRQATSEDELRERHRRQMFELNQRHSKEMDEQLQHYQDDLRRKDERITQQALDFEEKICEAKQELDNLKLHVKRLEGQRMEMTGKLQSMMQAHCSEALRLLQIGAYPSANSTLKHKPDEGLGSGIYPSSITSQPDSSSFNQSHLTNTMVTYALTQAANQLAQNGHLTLPTTSQPQHGQFTRSNSADHGLSSHLHKSNTTGSSSISYQPDLQQSSGQISTMGHSFVPTQAAGSIPSLLTLTSTHDDPITTNNISTGSGAAFMFRPIPAGETQRTSHGDLPQEGPIQTHNISKLSQESESDSYVSRQTILKPKEISSGGPFVVRKVASRSAENSFAGACQEERPLVKPPNLTTYTQQDPAFYTHSTTGSSQQALTHHQLSSAVVPSSSSQQVLVAPSVVKKPSFLETLASYNDSRDEDEQFRDMLQDNTLDSTMDGMSERFEQHEERQNELQHYIKMLLNRSPGDTEEDEAQTSQQDTSTGIFSPLSKDQAGPVMMSGDSYTATVPSQDQTKAGVTHKISAFTKSTVPTTRGQHSTGEQNTMASQPVGVLSPKQVGEIARLIGRYRPVEATGTDAPPVEELMTYLREMGPGEGNHQSSTETPPTSPGQSFHHRMKEAPTRDSGPKAKRNLAVTFQPTDKKQVGKVPLQNSTKAGSPNPTMRPSAGRGNLGVVAVKSGVAGKKSDKKAAGKVPAWK